MLKSEHYRDHARAAEDIAARTDDHLLRTNFLQLARSWTTVADQAEERARQGQAAHTKV